MSCFDKELFQKAVTNQTAKSKIAMEAGSISLDDFQEDDDFMFELSAVHVDTPKGVTAAQFSKVWCILEDDANRTLDITTRLNKQDADSSLARRFGTNNRIL